jgi:hypothetical protein
MDSRSPGFPLGWIALALAGGFVASVIHADEADSKADRIARAMLAAPASVSADATIMDVDGSVLRSGTNGWTCMPGIAPGDDHPMCNDGVWMDAMKALEAKEEFSTDRLGISYMLQGDANVNNADPFDTEQDPGEVWVQEGPHLMILVPKAALEGISDDPASGGPYVMWKDTPYAHVMVPIGPRASQ